jgi:hypothetical protein
MMIDLTGSEKKLLTPLWSAPSLMTTRHRREFALNALVTELICRPPSFRAVAGRKGPTFS